MPCLRSGSTASAAPGRLLRQISHLPRTEHVGGRDVKRFTFINAYVPSADGIGVGRDRRRTEGGGYEWVEMIDELRPVLWNNAARFAPLLASSLRPPAPAN